MTVARLLGKNAFGYAPCELEGKSVLGILHPADHAPFVQVSDRLLLTYLLSLSTTYLSCALPFVQTTRALLATSLSHPAGVDAPPQVKSRQ